MLAKWIALLASEARFPASGHRTHPFRRPFVEDADGRQIVVHPQSGLSDVRSARCGRPYAISPFEAASVGGRFRLGKIGSANRFARHDTFAPQFDKVGVGSGQPGDSDAPINAVADHCCRIWRNPCIIGAIAVFIPMVFQEHKGRCTSLRLHQLGTMPDRPVWHRRGLHAKPILSRGAARCAPTSSRVTSCGAAPGTACYHAGMADQAQRRHP